MRCRASVADTVGAIGRERRLRCVFGIETSRTLLM